MDDLHEEKNSGTLKRYKRYPAYKDSGVEWLGRIPAHWDTKRLRFVSQINPSKSEIAHFPDDFEVSFLPMEYVGDDGTLILEETRVLEQVWQGYTYFRDQDVMLPYVHTASQNRA